MKTWAVVNQKGGSCKTTTAVNLAAALGERGKRVLVVDLDSQQSASARLGFKQEDKGLAEVFTENQPLQPLVAKTKAAGVDLVPASPWLGEP